MPPKPKNSTSPLARLAEVVASASAKLASAKFVSPIPLHMLPELSLELYAALSAASQDNAMHKIAYVQPHDAAFEHVRGVGAQQYRCVTPLVWMPLSWGHDTLVLEPQFCRCRLYRFLTMPGTSLAVSTTTVPSVYHALVPAPAPAPAPVSVNVGKPPRRRPRRHTPIGKRKITP